MTNTEPRLIAGRYRLVATLATGGMGVVWKGWDERLERPVAVKQLRLEAGLAPSEVASARDRAMREARNTARLHHPHAVPVYDVVEQDGEPCLIMEFLPSISLHEALRKHGPLPPTQTARIGGEIAAALTAAHRAGIVHRDVKPGNVLLAEDGTAKLTDFGISHALGDPTLTATGMLTGTPAYLAPEVARGQPASFASDVFSLGSTLYTATEGSPPFGEDDNAMAVLHRVASGRLRPPQQSGALTPLLHRMLNPDPSARPSMTEVSEALSAVSGTGMGTGTAAPIAAIPDATTRLGVSQPVGSSPPTRTLPGTDLGSLAPPSHGPDRPRRRRAPIAALLAVAVVAAAVIVGVTLVRRNSSASTGDPANSPTAGRSKAPATSTAAGPTRKSSRTATSPPAGPTASALAQSVVDYYRLLPDNLRDGWARLTPAYRSGHAGGFNGYRDFWRQFRNVSASDVSGERPNTAVATIVYTAKNGQRTTERTSFRLVMSGGRLKIDGTTVLTSNG